MQSLRSARAAAPRRRRRATTRPSTPIRPSKPALLPVERTMQPHPPPLRAKLGPPSAPASAAPAPPSAGPASVGPASGFERQRPAASSQSFDAQSSSLAHSPHSPLGAQIAERHTPGDEHGWKFGSPQRSSGSKQTPLRQVRSPIASVHWPFAGPSLGTGSPFGRRGAQTRPSGHHSALSQSASTVQRVPQRPDSTSHSSPAGLPAQSAFTSQRPHAP